jgi:3,4-dihydroxy 2-butanone 4-phosphate synthase / GTP cyclohydrolase II
MVASWVDALAPQPAAGTAELLTVEHALEDYRAGRFVIIVDDEDRENEGDLAVAAELVTPEHISFMSRHAGGLVCVPIEASRLDELRIEPMVHNNTSKYGTAFSVSIEARDFVTTGISAHDRVATIRHLLNPAASPDDFAKPGHTFPLRAAAGGVLERAGQTEAAVDLARMAGLYPAGVICEVMKNDGTMARLADLREFGAEHGIRILAIKDLIAYRRRHELLVAHRAVAPVPINGKTWQVHAYEDLTTGATELALVLGSLDSSRPILVRAHSRCVTGDVFGSERCDCGPQLHAAMGRIVEEGVGVILYLGRHEGRGIGLIDKLRAYNLQDQGMDTVEANLALDQPADSREYGIGSQILHDLGVRDMRLLTNNPRKLIGLEGFGLTVVEQVPLRIAPNPHNQRYLATKKEKLGHLL